jgi:hypothetical protein
MTAPTVGPEEDAALADYLVRAVCDRASGRAEPECHHNLPHDVYFIGNLRPWDEEGQASPEQPAYLAELRNKLSPVAFGAEFLIGRVEEGTGISASVRWSCYYRVFPTFSQQRSYQSMPPGETHGGVEEESANAASRSSGSNTEGPSQPRSSSSNVVQMSTSVEEEEPEEMSPEAELAPVDRHRSRAPRDSLFIRFRKISCEASGLISINLTGRGGGAIDLSDLQAAVDRENGRAQEVAARDPDRLRGDGGMERHITVPQDALLSAEAFGRFLQTLRAEMRPAWRLEVGGELRTSETGEASDRLVRIEFVNASPRLAPMAGGRDNPNFEPFLFDAGARFSIRGAALLPFDLELAPRGFRYDRALWGRGFNCAISRVSTDPVVLETTHTPLHRQKRITTRTTPEAGFAELAREPLPTLEAIHEAMQAYLQVWRAAGAEYAGRGAAWRTEDQQEFDRDQSRFRDEIERYRRGLDLIASNQDVRLAFQLTNETFRRAGLNDDPARHKTSWRLFQLVFLVSQLPGIHSLASNDSVEASDRESVDIIYFPTGGGKTEAYLGVIVFHCFFDRLRGKAAGVTVWTRFPLRLLTLQQTQRVADVIGIADLVRRDQADVRLTGREVSEFAVGYFVGKEGTPNELVNPTAYHYAKEEDRANWSVANDPVARQAWKRVTRCPACKTTSVRLDFDSASVRLIHRCGNSACAHPGGEIPCYIVDNEIYRYLPTVVLGTIDKLAGLGNQRKLAQLFGQVDGRCAVHGYYKGKCPQKDCGERARLRPGIPPGLSGPTLFVQDELHLLKEGLGTFDSHYESFVRALRREFGQADTLKVIASSATIEAFDRQVQHLYSRQPGQARVFPGLGPRLGESFYAQTLDEPQRLYVGVLPHNKTIFNTILELIELYHTEIHRLSVLGEAERNPWGGRCRPGSREWVALLEMYVTSVTYFLAGRDLSSIRTDINGAVNPSLIANGRTPIDLFELTGDTNSDDVTTILALLEARLTRLPAAVGVLATSMISHGVDIDRLNAMIFYGMPRMTAEYIQSSSRVGRVHVGLVLTCLHPARERDQSHYTYFAKYHEFLGQLVEPVALNRWATFSIQRTLPGLFMAVLLQVIANRAGNAEVDRYYLVDYVKQKTGTGAIRQEMFYPLLEEAYLAGGGDPTGIALFRAELRLRVPQFLDQILSAGPEYRFISEVLIPTPMRSLRDVDEAVSIELDAMGSAWASQ